MIIDCLELGDVVVEQPLHRFAMQITPAGVNRHQGEGAEFLAGGGEQPMLSRSASHPVRPFVGPAPTRCRAVSATRNSLLGERVSRAAPAAAFPRIGMGGRVGMSPGMVSHRRRSRPGLGF